jgi:hypothetical protein
MVVALGETVTLFPVTVPTSGMIFKLDAPLTVQLRVVEDGPVVAGVRVLTEAVKDEMVGGVGATVVLLPPLHPAKTQSNKQRGTRPT